MPRASNAVLIVLTPGRALRWAPRWACSPDVVLFDASSGDYWLLSADGCTVIDWLQSEPGIDREDLLVRLHNLTPEGDALLGNLGSAGLLVGLVDGQPVRVPCAADVLD